MRCAGHAARVTTVKNRKPEKEITPCKGVYWIDVARRSLWAAGAASLSGVNQVHGAGAGARLTGC